MKRNYQSSLTMIAALAIILPVSAFGQDLQDQKKLEKHAGKDQQHGAKAAQQVQTQTVAPTGARLQGKHLNNTAVASQTTRVQGPATSISNKRTIARQISAPQTTTRNVQQPTQRAFSRQTQSRTTVSNQQAYTRSNNYGGLWSAGNTHGDWSRNGEHFYNNHHYRWYQGGWLIIDSGYNPYDMGGGSTVSNVQASLANAGYYHGPIDGDLGPGTRNAIAGYQNDHDLRVTGRINDPLLQSLQLE